MTGGARYEGLFSADPDFAGVTCPNCGVAEAEVLSLFGSTTSEVLFSCQRCRACFNWIKWRHELPPVAARRTGSSRARADHHDT